MNFMHVKCSPTRWGRENSGIAVMRGERTYTGVFEDQAVREGGSGMKGKEAGNFS